MTVQKIFIVNLGSRNGVGDTTKAFLKKEDAIKLLKSLEERAESKHSFDQENSWVSTAELK